MDGVLEIKNEHFWTVTFGSYVCPSILINALFYIHVFA